jgi:hypothetical protein
VEFEVTGTGLGFRAERKAVAGSVREERHMHPKKSWRLGAVMLCTLGTTAALLLLGMGAVTTVPPADSYEDPAFAAAPGLCSEATAGQDVLEAGGGGSCPDCPKNLPGGCSRASCDPCCYRCVGDPVLRCY